LPVSRSGSARQWLQDDRADERIAALHRRKNEHYAAIVEAGGLQLRPGVARLLDGLAGRRNSPGRSPPPPAAPISTFCCETTLGAAAAERFEATVCGEDVSRQESRTREAYLLALRQLQLPATRCLAVEDSASGLRSALAAGIATVIVRSLYHAPTRTSAVPLRVFDGYATGAASDGDGRGLGGVVLHRRRLNSRGGRVPVAVRWQPQARLPPAACIVSVLAAWQCPSVPMDPA